jgi:hypothetical protein
MNRAFDHNGVTVSASRPTKELKTVRKTLLIDSADRDVLKYSSGGDFVVYLPRVYKNIVFIRLAAAEFPSISTAFTHTYGAAVANGESTTYGANKGANGTDSATGVSTAQYFLIDIEGLNKTDETRVGADRSSFVDSTFAKIPITAATGYIEYNDHSAQDNISRYTPPIENLDRLHIRTRLHSQQGNEGFIYWYANSAYQTFSMTLEIEYMDNVFDSFSSFETRIYNKGEGVDINRN